MDSCADEVPASARSKRRDTTQLHLLFPTLLMHEWWPWSSSGGKHTRQVQSVLCLLPYCCLELGSRTVFIAETPWPGLCV